MGRARGEESYVAMPRWMGLGAIVLMAVVVLIGVGGIVSLGGRIRVVEGRAASTARSVGDIREDLSAKIENLAGRVDAGQAGPAAVRRLDARITSLADDFAAHEREDRSKELAASLARLESSVTSLKGDVIDAMRLASKTAETPAASPAPSAPTTPAVAAGDLDRLAERIAGIEKEVEEIAKARVKTSSSSRPRINEDAVKKLVEDTVKEQVEAELKAMRDRFRRR